MAAAHDLIGRQYGRLKVVARYENDPVGKSQWVCQCECGGAHIARGDNLVVGRTTRCPQCRIRTSDHVEVVCWYYHEPVPDRQHPGGMVTGVAGFATFSQGGRGLIEPQWFTGLVNKHRPPSVLAQSIRRAAAAGLFRCGTDNASIAGWIRRHKADITFHSFNEGNHVWEEWHRLTGEWRGPQDTSLDLSDLIGTQT